MQIAVKLTAVLVLGWRFDHGNSSKSSTRDRHHSCSEMSEGVDDLSHQLTL